MRVFVTGGSGFVGGYVIRELLARGHEVRCLVRPGAERRLPSGATPAPGDLFDPHGWRQALEGCDAVIHLVGVIREFPAKGITFRRHHVEATRLVVDEAKRAAVKRILHMSANGSGVAPGRGAPPSSSPSGVVAASPPEASRAGAVSAYQTTKFEAEQIVKASGLTYTIFRPSVIFGDPHGLVEFCSQLADVIRKAPLTPVFGDGQYRLDPVAVEEVAEAFANALDRPESAGRTFHLGGGNPLPYRAILDIIAKGMGRGGIVPIPVPFFAVATAAYFLDRFAFFPVTREQLAMLKGGNDCPELTYRQVLGTTPIPFTPEALGYLRRP
ncbi:MAG: NAD(P)H-binding protein [Nitrospinae bacterium]|nr:NAD(P)H-binding protein [Nitrospinota bacterium]